MNGALLDIALALALGIWLGAMCETLRRFCLWFRHRDWWPVWHVICGAGMVAGIFLMHDMEARSQADTTAAHHGCNHLLVMPWQRLCDGKPILEQLFPGP